MDRRGFLKLFGGVAAAAAVAPVIPFGRVWSFPSKIVIPEPALFTVIEGSPYIYNNFLETKWVTMETLRMLRNQMVSADLFSLDWDGKFKEHLKVGNTFTIAGVNKPNPLQRLKDREEFGVALLID